MHLDDVTKTVKQGQLWTQESLPADTLLLSTIVLRTSRKPGTNEKEADIGQWLQDPAIVPTRIQLGGNETTGQGFIALNWV